MFLNKSQMKFRQKPGICVYNFNQLNLAKKYERQLL